MGMQKVFRSRSYRYITTLVLGASLAVGASVWATSVGTNVSVSGTLAVTGATTLDGNTTLGNASTDVNLFTGTLQASTTALFTGNVTTYGDATFGNASTDVNLFTGTLQASTTALFSGAVTTYVGVTANGAVTINQNLTVATSTLFVGSENGRVGIGTTTPGATLSVSGLGTGVTSLLLSGINTIYASSSTSTIQSAVNGLSFATSLTATPLLSLDSTNARLGVGTGTPMSTFSVQGNSLISGTATVGNLVATNTLTVLDATSTNLAASNYASTSGLTVSNLTTLRDATSTNLAVTNNASTSKLVVSNTAKLGQNGTSITNVIFGFCDFGRISDAAAGTIAATSTGVVACQAQAPTGLAAEDKIWLTASTTASTTAPFIYTGIASSTASNRIQALIYNTSGVVLNVPTTTWQYLIIK